MCAVKIGWAKRDISTTEPVNINGQMYLRLSEGIHDPIMVTALCVDGGEGQDAMFFVSCDVTGIVMPVVHAVREKMEKYPHIPGKNIVLNATHTHSSSATFDTAEKSPDGRDIYPGAKYREFFTDMIVEAVCEAWETRKEGGIAYGYGYAVVGHSRRTIYSVDQGKANPLSAAPNGFGTMYGNTNKPDFSHYEAGADHFLNVMFTTDLAGKLTGMESMCLAPARFPSISPGCPRTTGMKSVRALLPNSAPMCSCWASAPLPAICRPAPFTIKQPRPAAWK